MTELNLVIAIRHLLSLFIALVPCQGIGCHFVWLQGFDGFPRGKGAPHLVLVRYLYQWWEGVYLEWFCRDVLEGEIHDYILAGQINVLVQVRIYFDKYHGTMRR